MAFFEGIVNFIGSIVHIIQNAVQWIVSSFGLIGSLISWVKDLDLFNMLPYSLAIIAGAFFTVSVVYLIIGR